MSGCWAPTKLLIPFIGSPRAIKRYKALGAVPGCAGACLLPAICVGSLGCITLGDIMIGGETVLLLSVVKSTGANVSRV